MTNQNVSNTSDIKSGRYSVSSIGPNFAPRNSFGTQRNSNPALYNRIISQQISSDERIEKMKRIVFLNEDIDLFEDETLMASKNSRRKLSLDFLNSFLPLSPTTEETKSPMKKSPTVTSLNSPISALIAQKKKEASANSDKKDDEQSTISSVTSASSISTLKAEPITQHQIFKKNEKTQKRKSSSSALENVGKYDTLTIYRRQRRTGVHFSPFTNFDPK